MQEIELAGTVRRTTGNFLSIEFDGPYQRAWIPWPHADPQDGQRVQVRGRERGLDGLRHRTTIEVLSREYRAGDGSSIRRDVVWPGKAPSTAARTDGHWLAALVEHRLVDDEARIAPEFRGTTATVALCRAYTPREAAARGFLHYDWKWANDTDDIVADFALALDAPSRFRLVSQRGRRVAFEVRADNGSAALEAVVLGPDPLCQTLLPRMNVWAERLGLARRIYELDTRSDRMAFLCRAPEEIARMVAAGIFTGSAAPVLCGAPETGAFVDWSDVEV